MSCLCCNDPEGVYAFRVFEIRTLHVRDFGGERLVQALGDVREASVCSACAEEELSSALSPGRGALRRALPFGCVLAVGAALSLTATLQSDVTALRLPGPAAVLCGLAGCASAWRDARARAGTFRALEHGAALERAAWERLLIVLPRKRGDEDLTYVPIDDVTRAMDVGALALRYDLLPPIAEQAVIKYLAELRPCE